MKAIIFDLDDTLIDWKNEYIETIYNYMVSHGHNITLELCYKISSFVDINEKLNDKLDKKGLLDFINKNCNINLSMDYMDDFIESFKNCYYEDKDTVDTIKYLSNKYDLYVITNFFTRAQTLRLDSMGIKKYFKKIIGADINYLKPHKNTFDIILNMYKPDECISIGDNLEKDIMLPESLGMNVIWKTNKFSDKYKTIKHIKELKNIL